MSCEYMDENMIYSISNAPKKEAAPEKKPGWWIFRPLSEWGTPDPEPEPREEYEPVDTRSMNIPG
jgi:hypothetical protein